jgi:hypothetical protein
MADEAAALRAAQGASEAERARLLADLATRIEAMVAWLAGNLGVSGAQLAGLTDLARTLRACDEPGAPGGAELDALMAEAIRVLAGFASGAEWAGTEPTGTEPTGTEPTGTEPAGAESAGAERAARPAFWKRSQ